MTQQASVVTPERYATGKTFQQYVDSGIRNKELFERNYNDLTISEASARIRAGELSPVDLASLDKWDDYTRAKEAMFLHCDTSDAPWTVIKSDCKKRARLNAMRFVLHRMPYAKKDFEAIGAVDPLIVGRPSLVPGRGDDQLAPPQIG